MHASLLHRRWVALLLALSLAISLTTVALATNIAINTNDNTIDINWPAAPFLSDTTGDVGDSNVDIFAARMATNHLVTPSDIAFRIDLMGQFPNTNGYFIRALLDCNRDGFMTHFRDVTIYLDPVDDVIYVRDGALNEDIHVGPTDKAEVVHFGGLAYTYEWKVPMGGGTVDWSGCQLGAIDVTFDTYDASVPEVMDTTDTRSFDIPNAVDITGVKGSSPGLPTFALVLALAALLLGVFGLLRLRASRS